VFFELNGQPRSVRVQDRSLAAALRRAAGRKREMPTRGRTDAGAVVTVPVSPGQAVLKATCW